MHLGLSTYTFPWSIGVPGYMPVSPMTGIDLLEIAIDYGISHVQFGDNLPFGAMSREEQNSIVIFARQHELTLELGMRGLRFDTVKQYVELAAAVRSGFLRVVIDDGNYEPAQMHVIKVIHSLLPVLYENNVVLAIENHDRFSSTDLQKIIAETDERYVGICLDTANSYGALEGTYETVKLLAPFAVNLHIKDILISRVQHKMGFRIAGTAAGQGMLNIRWIIEHVRNYGRCQSATIEIWSDLQADVSATIQTEKERAKTSIQYLKQLLNE